MMNFLWAIILLSSFVCAVAMGNVDAFGNALVTSSQNAVSFMISLVGVMAMWSGLMSVAEKTGLINNMSKILLPFTKILFPKQRDPETLSLIIMSFMANMFGAGNSSTVFSLRTMEKLDVQNHQNPVASNDMCMFAVVNMAFAPIVPVVTLQIRKDMGSADPFSIVLPSIITATCTIIFSVLICKFMERRS